MKLLIVDDEQHVIKAIKFLINATKLHITAILEASCVQDAISIIEAENPELIITDVVMDDFTGIDLMEYLKGQELPAKVIVVSGYNEYSYIRSTLQNGGIDYLLKPIDGSQLNAALEKAISVRAEEQKQHARSQELIDSMYDICKESLLYKLITQSDPEKSYAEFIRILPQLEQEHSVCLGYSTCKYWQNEDTPAVRQQFLKLQETIHGMLAESDRGFCFFPPDTDSECYIFIYQEHNKAIAAIQDMVTDCFLRQGIPFAAGLSQICSFPEEAPVLKDQAEQAFLSQDACAPGSGVIPYDAEAGQPALPSLSREEDQMFSALITCNESVIQASADAFLAKAWPGSCHSFGYLEGFMEHYAALMRRWTKRLNEHYGHMEFTDCQPLSPPQLLDGQYRISLPRLRQQLLRDLQHYSDQLSARGTDQEHNVIHQIAHYIQLNYTKPYNQVDYARLFFINKDYMCRKFKSTFHINMVSYITQLRIQKAKELLASSDMKIRDIAQAVGFDDEKYFSRRFNQEAGMSPNEFRISAKSLVR